MTQPRQIEDPREIEFQHPDEMRYWVKFLDTSQDELLAAISAVGTSAQKVREHLEAKARRKPG